MLFIDFIRNKTLIAVLKVNIPSNLHLLIGMVDALWPFHLENRAWIIILFSWESIYISHDIKWATHQSLFGFKIVLGYCIRYLEVVFFDLGERRYRKYRSALYILYYLIAVIIILLKLLIVVSSLWILRPADFLDSKKNLLNRISLL